MSRSVDCSVAVVAVLLIVLGTSGTDVVCTLSAVLWCWVVASLPQWVIEKTNLATLAHTQHDEKTDVALQHLSMVRSVSWLIVLCSPLSVFHLLEALHQVCPDGVMLTRLKPEIVAVLVGVRVLACCVEALSNKADTLHSYIVQTTLAGDRDLGRTLQGLSDALQTLQANVASLHEDLDALKHYQNASVLHVTQAKTSYQDRQEEVMRRLLRLENSFQELSSEPSLKSLLLKVEWPHAKLARVLQWAASLLARRKPQLI
eukprot:m.319342 g.319342  ORF g.319342 m.319342 type:complete len:259 (-) comp23125_c1_seq1:28-804(-)